MEKLMSYTVGIKQCHEHFEIWDRLIRLYHGGE